MNALPATRRRNGVVLLLKVLLLCLGLGVLAGLATVLLESLAGVSGLWISAPLIMAAMAAGLWASVWWWRQLDEAAREAHKWAWFWGGSAGMAFCLSLLVAAGLRPEDLDASLRSVAPSDLVRASVACLLGCQMIGYGAAWAFWWLRHR